MTHAIKQIVDTDGEPMMEVVVHSDCSAVDMEAIHAEALEMNMGIELALRIIAAMGGNESPGDAAGGCLYRGGFNEINYLVSVALSLYARREEAHTEALEMNLFEDRIAAAGKLMFKHREESAIEACHAEALEMNASYA